MLQQVSKMDDMAKIEFLQKRSTELLAEMRRLDRDNQKNKKRGDALQKEKDQNRTELSKTISLKEKLEKLCRELQRDNNKLKVRTVVSVTRLGVFADWPRRTRTSRSSKRTRRTLRNGTTNTQKFCTSLRHTKRKRTTRTSILAAWTWKRCKWWRGPRD